MYKKIVGIVFLMLLITTTLPALGIIIEKEKPVIMNFHGFSTGPHEEYTITNPSGVVLWDNGMHYHNAIVSQWDPKKFEAIGADDFQFEETTEITDVHWMSLYAGYNDLDFDWNITFYIDRGDGMAPGDKIYEQIFPNADVHETFIEEIEKWSSWMFSYWVDLPDAITFTGGEKYWITIQGIGTHFPASYWACHAPVVLHELVWKSRSFGYLDWITSSEMWDMSRDFCFQLTGDGEPLTPNLECEGNLIWEDVPPGTELNKTIMIMNNGDVGSMLKWEVLSIPKDWGTNWTLNWTSDGYHHSDDFGFVGTSTPEDIIVEFVAPGKKGEYAGEIILVNSDNSEDTCSISVSCTVPRTRATFNPLLQHLFERFPNAFPILRYLLGFQ